MTMSLELVMRLPTLLGRAWPGVRKLCILLPCKAIVHQLLAPIIYSTTVHEINHLNPADGNVMDVLLINEDSHLGDF